MAEQTNFRGNPNWSLVPEHTRDSIRLYVERHFHPGDFVHAVMSNNFILASRLADEKNRAQLADIGRFIYAYCPGDCCGDPANVKTWLTRKRDEDESCEQAIVLRDQALILVRKRGTWELLDDAMCLSYKSDALSIRFRTPYHRLPKPDDPAIYWASDRGRALGSLPYQLVIWAPEEVLDIEWDDNSRVKVVSYRAGNWEANLRAASIAIPYPSVGSR